MEPYTLKDYRATHILINLIRSNVQGWYTRENILLLANHSDGNEEKLKAIARLIDTANSWNDAIQPDKPPFLNDNGTVNNPELVEDVCKMLMWLFGQYAQMSDRLNAILDNPEPLHNRKEDFQYIVACTGWVYYLINHTVHGDNHFGEIFNDYELLDARVGHASESQKEVDFVNYLFYSFKDEETYNPQTCADLTSIIETLMNESMKESATQIDKYLTLFGK